MQQLALLGGELLLLGVMLYAKIKFFPMNQPKTHLIIDLLNALNVPQKPLRTTCTTMTMTFWTSGTEKSRRLPLMTPKNQASKRNTKL